LGKRQFATIGEVQMKKFLVRQGRVVKFSGIKEG